MWVPHLHQSEVQFACTKNTFMYGWETHLREVRIYVKSHIVTSWLTLGGDIRQKLTFKERTVFLLAFSLSSGSKYIILPAGC